MTFRNTAGAINGYTHTFNVENELVGVVNNDSTTAQLSGSGGSGWGSE